MVDAGSAEAAGETAALGPEPEPDRGDEARRSAEAEHRVEIIQREAIDQERRNAELDRKLSEAERRVRGEA